MRPTFRFRKGESLFTASATCTAGAGQPRYLFFIRDTLGAWQTVCPYQSSGACVWDTTGLPKGAYGLQVWARQQGSARAVETTGKVRR